MPCDNNAKTSSEIEHVDWSTGTGSGGQNYVNVRFGSGSSQASQSSGDICRICHCESDPQNPLLTPCYCSGSLKYVHQSCLQQWLTASDTNSCELCKFPFIMHTKIKPFNEWRSLDISGIERRRLCCSVLFHCAAALCVIWSLCVLIERAADDVQRGLIDWPFWTKLAVVTVGLTGGIVFMYIQCKAYLHLCHRWKARNRILLIQNAPEKIHPPPSPVAATHNKRNSRISDTLGGTAANAGNGGNVEINNASVSATGVTYGGAGNVAVGLVGQDVASVGDDFDIARHLATVAGIKQNSQRLMNASRSHHLQQAELDMLDTQSAQSEPAQPTNVQQSQQQVAVAANIECAQLQHNYERDWALDDVVSQISSFRPCPQGSGSMTPFHDSIHNVLEHSEASSRGSVNDLCVGSRQDLSTGGISTDTGRENALQLSSFSGSGEHKAPSISSGVSNAVANGLGGFAYRPHTTNKRYSNSSIFLENRDILNDSVALGSDSSNTYDYSTHPKIDYRHSSMLTTTMAKATTHDTPAHEGENSDHNHGKDLRRYSDTKLLGSCGDSATEHDAMLSHNDAVDAAQSTKGKRRKMQQNTDVVLDMELPTSSLSPPAAFANQRQQATHTLRRSLDVFGDDVTPVAFTKLNGVSSIPATATDAQIDRTRLFFKSLPNLSSSCESLIKK